MLADADNLRTPIRSIRTTPTFVPNLGTLGLWVQVIRYVRDGWTDGQTKQKQTYYTRGHKNRNAI